MIEVVCGVIFKDEKVFICRRKEGKSLAGFWEFPGGKIEPGERHQAALFRELHEELGMTVLINSHLITTIHDYGSFAITLIAFSCTFQKATFQLSDHDAFDWVLPADLKKLNLAPADISIAERLLN